MLKQLLVKLVIPVADALLSPLTIITALYMKLIRRVGVYRMTISRAIFNRVGVFPIRDHYYEPLFNPTRLRKPLSEARALPGINWNAEGQLALLAQFAYNEELLRFPRHKTEARQFYYSNDNFGAGDAECLYNMVRRHKPKRIVEIGSGFSTLLAYAAILENKKEQADYSCEHICIEPYEMGWLEGLDGVKIVRQIVEEVDLELYRSLEENDILFIDSSHVIRPQGDVLCEYLEILPILNSGVLVHIHDIFSPRDYPREWVIDQVKFWNEQYLLEAFLSCNQSFEVVCAVNFLKYNYPGKLAEKCPVFAKNPDSYEPGSFWIRKVAGAGCK